MAGGEWTVKQSTAAAKRFEEIETQLLLAALTKLGALELTTKLAFLSIINL